MSTRFSFKSPLPKRFVQAWTSPLIPGLKDSASWDATEPDDDFRNNSSSLMTVHVDAPPLGDRSLDEYVAATEASVIQTWLDSEEKKSSVDSKSSPSSQGASIFRTGSPSANAAVQSGTGTTRSPKLSIPDFSPFTIYAAESPKSAADFSPITMSRAVETENSKERPVLADISKTSTVAFVPNSWLSLYHSRPRWGSNEETIVNWLECVVGHLRNLARGTN